MDGSARMEVGQSKTLKGSHSFQGSNGQKSKVSMERPYIEDLYFIGLSDVIICDHFERMLDISSLTHRTIALNLY